MVKRLLRYLIFAFGGLVMIGFLLYFGNRVRQRLERAYFENLVLNPGESTDQLSPELLAEMEGHLRDGNFGSVYSFLIYQEGEVRYRYHDSPGEVDRTHAVFSIGKSVTSAVVGIALEDPEIDIELDRPIVDYLPEYRSYLESDPEKGGITLDDLLTMRSGLDWNELSLPSDFNFMYGASDWVIHILDREMAYPAGESFIYNSGNTILASDIVGRQAGISFDQYAQAVLFDRLEIETATWRTGANEIINTGGGLRFRADDMLKFGILYLQNGVWEGEQVVPSDWVDLSTARLVDDANRLQYGYQWWQFPDTDPMVHSLSVNDLYFASGIGGNYIYVIPHLETVIVITADDDYSMERAYPALKNYIFPALENERRP